jgi:hypothetical protein
MAGGLDRLGQNPVPPVRALSGSVAAGDLGPARHHSRKCRCSTNRHVELVGTHVLACRAALITRQQLERFLGIAPKAGPVG